MCETIWCSDQAGMERCLASVRTRTHFDKLTGTDTLHLTRNARDVERPPCFQFSLRHQRLNRDVVPLDVKIGSEIITVPLKQITQRLHCAAGTAHHVEANVGDVLTHYLLKQLGQHFLCNVVAHRLLTLELGKEAVEACLLCRRHRGVGRDEQGLHLVGCDTTVVVIHSLVNRLLDLAIV